MLSLRSLGAGGPLWDTVVTVVIAYSTLTVLVRRAGSVSDPKERKVLKLHLVGHVPLEKRGNL